ncbi:MAG: OadG family protein [Clostridiales bacterium]|jgi:hypothetical protein|nr:OadG family protein [Clostridiales bacterium]
MKFRRQKTVDININNEECSVNSKDEELAAVITAAVMAYYGAQTKCSIKVSSFKRISDSSGSWKRAGQLEWLRLTPN